MGNIEHCGMTVTDDGRCARRKAHHGHCAVGGSYALALDERDDARQQLQGAVGALQRIAAYPLGDPLPGREANKIARAALGRDPQPPRGQ